MAAGAIPVYFELNWAILSTIGLTTTFLSLMVIGITGFSKVSLVPVVVSISAAIANGMCYYAFYAEYPIINTVVASCFADVCWLIQEAGLSFYSYTILTHMLTFKDRQIFFGLFWLLILVIVVLRVVILITRVRYITGGNTNDDLLHLVNNLHVGYFTTIALVEVVSAWFLLHKFSEARRRTKDVAIRYSLFSYLLKSTEVRLSMLAIIGVTRAITYSFQNTVQSASGSAGQLDRFCYTLECMFPVVMIIDMLGSRLAIRPDDSTGYGRSSTNAARGGAVPGPRKTWRRMNDDKSVGVKSGQDGTTNAGDDDPDSKIQIFDGVMTLGHSKPERVYGVQTSVRVSSPGRDVPLQGITISRVDNITITESRLED